jgi:hypothetical protein
LAAALWIFEQLAQVRLWALGQGLQGLPRLALVWGDEWGHGWIFVKIIEFLGARE